MKGVIRMFALFSVLTYVLENNLSYKFRSPIENGPIITQFYESEVALDTSEILAGFCTKRKIVFEFL